jgi:hypothetical protein
MKKSLLMTLINAQGDALAHHVSINPDEFQLEIFRTRIPMRLSSIQESSKLTDGRLRPSVQWEVE